MLIYDVVDVFDTNKIRYAIVGGYALALHGLVRNTVDIDIVLKLRLKDFEKAEDALKSLGLSSRLPITAKDVISMRDEYIKKRNLIAWSFVDYVNPMRQVDILINTDMDDISVKNISVGSRKIRVASLQDLLKMKTLSARPQDLIDIENIKDKLSAQKK